MDISLLDQLEQEHREAEGLIEQIGQAGQDQQPQLVEQLCDALTRHMDVEEAQVYPTLRSIDSELGSEAQREHDETRQAITALREAAGSAECDQALEKLRSGLAHHIEEEEGTAFPELRANAGSDADASM